MKQSKKPSWKDWLSNWTTSELQHLALRIQIIALALQIGALILTFVRLVQ